MDTEKIEEVISIRLSPDAAKALFVMQQVFDKASRSDIVSSAIVITHMNVVSMFGFLRGMPSRVFMRFIAIVATFVGMGLLIGWLTDYGMDSRAPPSGADQPGARRPAPHQPWAA